MNLQNNLSVTCDFSILCAIFVIVIEASGKSVRFVNIDFESLWFVTRPASPPHPPPPRLLYTAQWKFLCPCHVNAYNCQLLLHMHWNFMKFGQNSANANHSLYAQLHTKASTVSKSRQCLSSGKLGVALTRIFPYIHVFTIKKSNKGAWIIVGMRKCKSQPLCTATYQGKYCE